jgi:O-antigen/teichoic acid export membrane protein
VARIIRITLAITAAQLAACWPLAGHPQTASAGVLAIAALALAGALVAVLAHTHVPGSAIAAGPLLRRAVALRRRSWGAAFQRQRDPDAAGRARPRAPSAAPAAA